jgi:hypothetical protein
MTLPPIHKTTNPVVLSYTDVIEMIKVLCNSNNTSSEICDTLGIVRYEFYNICKREHISYTKQYKGKQLGAKDKKKRQRSTKIKTPPSNTRSIAETGPDHEII